MNQSIFCGLTAARCDVWLLARSSIALVSFVPSNLSQAKATKDNREWVRIRAFIRVHWRLFVVRKIRLANLETDIDAGIWISAPG
jgi:hypothetical protein